MDVFKVQVLLQMEEFTLFFFFLYFLNIRKVLINMCVYITEP